MPSPSTPSCKRANGGGVVSELGGTSVQTAGEQSGVTYTADGRPLYESASDTIYIYNALQTAVSRQEDAADQPVLTGDGDAKTFGTGQPIYAAGSDEPLTYSPEHTYVYADGWDEGLEDAGDNNNVVVSDEPEDQEESDAEKDEPVEKNDAAGKDVVETEPTEDSAEKSTESDEVDLLADGDETEAYNSLSGRDYVGQVTKQIGDETYILIGNEQQLRAIGSNKEVHGIVYHRPTVISEYSKAYNGDADLGEGEVLGDIPSPGLGSNCGVDSTGAKDESASWETGLNYTSNANYIIFRDIDVSSGGDWTPLMFEGVLIGAKASGNETIWDEKGSEITATESPRIIGVNVDVTGVLDTSKYAGVGFFGTISSKMNPSNLGLSGGTTIVDNITLVAPQVNNQATGFEDLPDNLVEWLLSLLGNLASGLLGGAEYIIQILTGAITGTGGLKLGLSDLIKGLLSLRNDDPTTTATGTFAGRVVGDVRINNCNVVPSEEGAQASVTSSWGLTGGFVGYSEGMTEYDGLSGLLKFATDALETILNAIPGLGLGDLITLLLRNNIINVSQLIPTGYVNPMIEGCTVSLSNTTIGTSSSSKNGGFIGEQVGTIILNSQVLTPVTVLAETYAGGFSGVARNGVMKGALSDLGVELIRVAQPQSVTQGCSTVGATVTAGSYAGGFTGALANSYSVNDTVKGSVSAKATSHTVTNEDGSISTYALSGGFAGAATLGWATDLGSKEAGENNLLGSVSKLLVTLLGGDAGGEGADTGKASTLLSLVGIDNSAILGAQMTGGTIQVESKGNYAGGLLGRGDGVMIAASDDEHLNELDTYDRAEEIGTVGRPTARDNKIEGLQSVTAADSFAGGIAGRVGTASIGGLLNTTLGLGGYLPYEVSDISVSGVADGYTVEATSGMSAGGGIGEATGGLSKDVELSGVKSVKAVNRAGGFAGVVGPGDLVGTGGLDLLGLGALTVKGLLSVAEGVNVSTENVAVSGVNSGMTVESTGKPYNNEDRSVQYVAGGFIGKANSVQVTTSHVDNLLNVKAADYSGYAGGFVGTSVTGGLADVSDETDLKGLISAGNLLTAVGYLVPTYTDVYTSYVDAGGVEAEVAGGFAGDFQSGFINTTWNAEKVAYEAVKPASGNYVVYNIDHVKGRLFAGGFGGRVTSGGLASSGDKGGLSILGDIAGLSIKVSDLLSLVDAYVPMINYAGVSSTPKGAADDAADDGFTVATAAFDEGVSGSGSAGGYIGYASGAQIGYSDVSTLRHTTVEEPKDLEATSAPSYFGGSSSYAVSAPRCAGGFFGLMDIGNAASLGEGLDVLGNSIELSNVLEALSVVVSTVEHSSVYGAPGGYAVLASGSSAKGSAEGEKGDLGHAGGFAGLVLGGQIQDANAYNFSHIIGQESAGGYAGSAEPGNVASVLGSSDLLGGLVSTDGALAQLAEDFVPSIRNSETTSVPCGGVVRANAFSNAESERGMAGGYIGRNEGAQIWGNNTKPWKAATEAYDGPTREAAAWRIRSVYGAEFAGGFTGIMKPAETAETGNLSLLWGLIKVDNALGALGVAYPTEENTAVYGPLQGLDMDTWNSWVKHVGSNGGYGSDLAASGTVSSQDDLEDLIANHVYGINVVAGREEVATAREANPLKGGSAGGYVGAMIAGTVTDGQAHDVKLVRALRGAGGFAGTAEAGGAATLGSVSILGDLNLNLGQLLDVAQVFVPVIKNSSVEGYRMGMTVAATGAGRRNDNITNATGNAGGYIGYGAGAQIWGDGTVDLPVEGEDSATQAIDADAQSAAGCNVSNLRRVQAPAYAGGFAGRLTSGSTANINTDGVSDGFLQGLLDTIIDSTGITDLVSVLQATMSTVRGANVSAADDAWGFTVEAFRNDNEKNYPLAAGGFVGLAQATIIGDISGSEAASTSIEGLRGIEGGLYAGGFVGVAQTGGVAEVAGSTGEGAEASILDLLKLGNASVIQAFQPVIYDATVNGVADGVTVRAHTWDKGGLLGSQRVSGNAGGFAGTIMGGMTLRCGVSGLNSVSAPNYSGGFVGYTGKTGIADVENVSALGELLGVTAGVANVIGTTVEGCSVAGKAGGFTVVSQGTGGATPENGATGAGEQMAGGFVGYADVSHVTGSNVTNLKLVRSPQAAGGFAATTSYAYLVSAEVDSKLVDALLQVVSKLLQALRVGELENLDVINISLGGKILELKVLGDGDALSVTLLGIKVTVSLVKGTGDGQTDVVNVTIGDSTITLPVNEDGTIDTDQAKAELQINLIKGNRTVIEKSSVTGISEGYDVFGGGATQTGEAQEGAPSGYAGGFVGHNNEGRLFKNDMRYADVVSGSAGKTGPFTGATSYSSNWWFNDVTDIEQGNTYHVYRDPSLAQKNVEGVDADAMSVSAGRTDGGDPADQSSTEAVWARFDVSGHRPVNGTNHEDWKGATVGGAPLGVYASAGKAVLMDDTAVTDNTGGLTPEPGDGQDPCAQNVDVTIQKIWKDGFFGSVLGNRPNSITVKLTASYTTDDGKSVFPKTIQPVDENGKPYGDMITNPIVVELTASENGSLWSETWRKVLEGLPVAIKDENDEVHYLTYTASETDVTFGEDKQSPSDLGYIVSVSSDAHEKVITITNTKQGLLPGTGGTGTAFIMAAGLMTLVVGGIWLDRQRRRRAAAQTVWRPTGTHFRD